MYPEQAKATGPISVDAWALLCHTGRTGDTPLIGGPLGCHFSGESIREVTMSLEEQVECCPRFDPTPWDEQEVTWEGKLFAKDRVRSFLHIPLNFGAVMKRTTAKIEAVDAKPARPIVLSDENSLWGADVYVEVTKDVPDAAMATISGRFLTKAFEGSYQNIRKWINEMNQFVASRDEKLHKLYCYYTTCPKCAKKHGENYVVLVAQV